MVKDEDTGELILEIEVRGKTGVGYCKSRPDAVNVYQQLMNRPKWTPQGRKARSKKDIAAAEKLGPKRVELRQPTDKLVPGSYLKLFNKILNIAKIKLDRNDQPHTLYSLRHGDALGSR